MMLAIVLLTIIIGITIGIFIARTISNPLNKASSMLDELGKGHLDIRLNMDTKMKLDKWNQQWTNLPMI